MNKNFVTVLKIGVPLMFLYGGPAGTLLLLNSPPLKKRVMIR